MDTVTAFVSQIFGDKSLYEILCIEKTATEDEIKRAYRKLALVHHPDRSGGDTETFKALSIVHSILSDSSKRALYDSTGEVDNEGGDGENFDDWYDYFRNLFPKLTSEKIESFAKTYVGSEEEREDLVEAYKKFNGDVDKIMEVVILAEIGEEERLCTTIDAIISFGDLQTTSEYEEFKKKHRTAAGKFKKKRKSAKKEDTSESDLAALMMRNKAARGNPFGNIMEKYGGKKDDPFDDISDEAFLETQKNIFKDVKGKDVKIKQSKKK